jgi:hypothetical protein
MGGGRSGVSRSERTEKSLPRRPRARASAVPLCARPRRGRGAWRPPPGSLPLLAVMPHVASLFERSRSREGAANEVERLSLQGHERDRTPRAVGRGLRHRSCGCRERRCGDLDGFGSASASELLRCVSRCSPGTAIA